MKIVERPYVEASRRALLDAGMHPVLARVYAGRNIRTAAELNYGLDGLIPPGSLKGIDAAAALHGLTRRTANLPAQRGVVEQPLHGIA